MEMYGRALQQKPDDADLLYARALMAEKVDHFLEEYQDTTFFLYYAINLPHYPLQGTGKWREHYQDLEIPRSKYAACVSTVDERIGQMLTKLESLGLRENTIIIFQSDHGHSMEERTFGGGGNSGIYRGAKFSLFEGGIRVPAMISWKGSIPQGEVRDQMCVNVDWLPTVLELCNLPYETTAYEGKSMKKIIMDNDSTAHDVFCWYSRQNRWAVRKGDWKLLMNPIDPTMEQPLPERDSLFLTNISTHPEERENMAQQYPDKVAELTQEYQDWYQKVK
jgi:arylsulfatase A-like enzyme